MTIHARTLALTGALVALLVITHPILAIFFQIGSVLNGPSVSSTFLLSSRQALLLGNSVMYAAIVALVTTSIASLAAVKLTFTRRLRPFRWLVLVPAVIPLYIHALAWSSTTETINRTLAQTGFGTISVSGWIPSAWVHILGFLPATTALAILALESVDQHMVESALVRRSSTHALARIVLPLAAPMLASGTGLVFILCLMDYSIPSLFLVNVYSLEIFANYSATNDVASTAFLSMPLLFAALLVCICMQSAARNAAHEKTTAWPAILTRFPPSRLMYALTTAATVLVALQFIVPAVALLRETESPAAALHAIINGRGETIATALIASSAAVLSIPCAILLSRIMDHRRIASAAWILVLLPLTMPAPLVGMGLVSFWNHHELPVYGTVAMPILASIVRFAPVAAVILYAQAQRADPLLLDAARVFQCSAIRRLVSIRLPALLPGMIAAFAAVLALAAGELGATLIVVPPGMSTLTLRIYNYLHYGASAEVAGLCLAMTACTLAAGAIAVFSMTRHFGREGQQS